MLVSRFPCAPARGYDKVQFFTFTCYIHHLNSKTWHRQEIRPSISTLPMWNKAWFCRYCLLNKTLLPSCNLIPQQVNRESCSRADETKERLTSIKTAPKIFLKWSRTPWVYNTQKWRFIVTEKWMMKKLRGFMSPEATKRQDISQAIWKGKLRNQSQRRLLIFHVNNW